MNSNWRSFLESTGAVFKDGGDEVLSFGDASGELQAARNQTVLVPLTHLGLIEATGDDAKAFLHSQFTSDINHLGADQVQHSAWCTAKGRMQASFLAWRETDTFRLAISGDLEAASLKRLQMFVLRSKVKLASLTETHLLLGLAGPQAAAALGDAGLPCPGAAMTSALGAEASVLGLEANRYVIAVRQEVIADLWRKLALKAHPAGLPAWRWLDVQAGFPGIRGDEGRVRSADGRFRETWRRQFPQGVLSGSGNRRPHPVSRQGQASSVPRSQRPVARGRHRSPLAGQSGSGLRHDRQRRALARRRL